MTAAQRVAERLNDWLEAGKLPDGENARTVAEDLGLEVDRDATDLALDLFGDCDPVVVDGELVRYDYGDDRYCVFDWAENIADFS